VMLQTKYLSATQERVFCTNNKWRGTIYADNTGILWYDGGL
jgi:hypothetical protein